MKVRVVTIYEPYPLNAAVKGLAMNLEEMPTTVALINVERVSVLLPASGLIGTLPGLPGEPGELHLDTGEMLWTPDVEGTADELFLDPDTDSPGEDHIIEIAPLGAREVAQRQREFAPAQ